MRFLIIVISLLLSPLFQQLPLDFDQLQPITAQNAAQITPVANLGLGVGRVPFWSPDEQTVYYPSSVGVWEYRLDQLPQARLLDSAPIPEPEVDFSVPDDPQLPIATSADGRYRVFEEIINEDGREAILWLEDTVSGEKQAIHANGTMWRTYSAIPFIPRFSAAGLLFARSNKLYRWNTASHTEELLIPEFIDISISPSGRYAVGYAILPMNVDVTFSIWDLETAPAKVLVEQFFPGTGPWLSLAFSPDGNSIATGGNNANVRIWDIASRGMNYRESDPPEEFGEEWLDDLAYSSDGNFIVGCFQSISPVGWAFVMEAMTNKKRTVIEASTETAISSFVSVAFHPTEKIVALGAANGNIYFWSLNELVNAQKTNVDSALKMFSGHMDAVIDLAFSADGQLLATASRDNHVRLWNYKTGETIAVLDAHTAPVSAIAFYPQGGFLITAAEDGLIFLWNLSTYEHTIFPTQPGLPFGTPFITDFAFSPDGSILAAAHYNADVYIWDFKQKKQLALLNLETLSRHIAFNREGTLLATGSYDGTVKLWGVMP